MHENQIKHEIEESCPSPVMDKTWVSKVFFEYRDSINLDQISEKLSAIKLMMSSDQSNIAKSIAAVNFGEFQGYKTAKQVRMLIHTFVDWEFKGAVAQKDYFVKAHRDLTRAALFYMTDKKKSKEIKKVFLQCLD